MVTTSAERAEQAFQVARQRAWFNTLRSRIFRWPRAMLSLGDVRRHITLRGQHELGSRAVPLAHIIGSEGRAGDFDRHFLLLSPGLAVTWQYRVCNFRKHTLSPTHLMCKAFSHLLDG